MARLRRPARAATLLVAGLLLVSGCGSDGADGSDQAVDAPSTPASSLPTSPTASPSETPSDDAEAPPGAPACGQVWVTGSTLPRSYEGCVDAGAWVPRDSLGCSSGQRLVRYDERFYAVLGGPVQRSASPLDGDAEYRDIVEACRA